MTLVIYVPFKNGASMISDRQNTYFEDLTREPIDKIVELPTFRVILGFAGPTQQCRYLVDQLRRENASSPFRESYERVYRRCCGLPELGFHSEDVELLTLIRGTEGRGHKVHKILGAVMNELDEKKCTAIGAGAKFIVPQLQLETREISKKKGQEFGLALLEYASIIDISVGSPTTYGYNIATIEGDTWSVSTCDPTSVSIEKLLYNFED